MDEQQKLAVEAYEENFGRVFVPDDEVVMIPIDALLFSEYQHVWTDLDEYWQDRCIYDPETNEELIYFVTTLLREDGIPPIYVDILEDGVALVDGVHRTTAAFIAGDTHIAANLNKEANHA